MKNPSSSQGQSQKKPVPRKVCKHITGASWDAKTKDYTKVGLSQLEIQVSDCRWANIMCTVSMRHDDRGGNPECDVGRVSFSNVGKHAHQSRCVFAFAVLIRPSEWVIVDSRQLFPRGKRGNRKSSRSQTSRHVGSRHGRNRRHSDSVEKDVLSAAWTDAPRLARLAETHTAVRSVKEECSVLRHWIHLKYAWS